MNNQPQFLKFSCFQAIWLRLRCSAFVGSLTLLSFGCATAPPPKVNLDLQIQPGGRPGLYIASGTTNLPDRSRLIVMAIRPLHPGSQPRQPETDRAASNYVILERRPVEVKQGQWQTNLNLWQVAPNGQFQEVWQLNQPKLGATFTPEPNVTFLATFDPANQLPSLQPQLEPVLNLEGPLVRFTTDGQRYLQTSETLSLALPTGKTTPPALSAADQNHGWGDRSGPADNTVGETKRSSVPPGNPGQTTAPLTSDQVLR